MSHEDQIPLVDFVTYYNKHKDHPMFNRRSEDIYVPVTFHLVADNDRKGRIKPISVLRQFEKVRKDFESLGIHIYLAGGRFNFLNNSKIYEDPLSNDFAIRNNKNKTSLNVFITENANTGSEGVTLGYYRPNGDYVVVRKASISSDNNTLSHELGHMFSLPHTFWGWESSPWDKDRDGTKVTRTFAPGSNRYVELVDKSNCEIAADRICDTPPDYNFGYSASSCSWKTKVYDKNDSLIVPMENNYMSYFLSCREYQFTEGQKDIMKANLLLPRYNNNDRSFLQSGYVPTSDTISHDFEILSPVKNSTTETYDFVELDWEDAAGATAYYVEVNVFDTRTGKVDFYARRTTESKLDLDYLSKGNFVSWTVMPYNESRAGAPFKTSTFTTGSTSDVEDENALSQLQLIPNPASAGGEVYLDFYSTSSDNGTIIVSDMQGRTISSQSLSINQGNNRIDIDTNNMNQGIYLIQVNTPKGRQVKKLTIQ